MSFQLLHLQPPPHGPWGSGRASVTRGDDGYVLFPAEGFAAIWHRKGGDLIPATALAVHIGLDYQIVRIKVRQQGKGAYFRWVKLRDVSFSEPISKLQVERQISRLKSKRQKSLALVQLWELRRELMNWRRAA